MKYRKTLAALLVVLLALTGVAMADGEEYLITLSWLKEHLTDAVTEELDDGLAQLEADVQKAASSASAGLSASGSSPSLPRGSFCKKGAPASWPVLSPRTASLLRRG